MSVSGVSMDADCFQSAAFPTSITAPLSATGFPSPADDFYEYPLDPRQLLIQNPTTTFFLKVMSDAMSGIGLSPGDLVVVDRSLKVGNNRIAVVAYNGEFMLRRFLHEKGRIALLSENPAYPPIPVLPASDLEVWGCVTYAIKSL